MPTSPGIMLRLLLNHPANCGRRVQALAKAASWQTFKRTFKKPTTITVYDGLKFRAYPDSTQPGRFLYFGGYPDYEEMMFMRRYLRPGDGFIDGGANEGMFALLAGQLVGPTGEVHAFEVVPRYVERLRENLALNNLPQVVVHPQAVGVESGEVAFVVRGTGSRIQTADDHGGSINATVVRLDAVLPAREWAMGKLDLEGAEHLALRGAADILEQVAVWMLEVIDPSLKRFGSSERDLRDWLDDIGYDTVVYAPDANRFVPAPDPIWPLADLMAVRRDRLAEVQERLRSFA